MADPQAHQINRSILRLAVPAVLSNIAVPLLGLCDTFITGHLGHEVFLAAIAVGTIMVNSSYWLFGFLRAGTSGLTAEAFGRGDIALQRSVLTLSLAIALATGLLITAIARPLSSLLLGFIDAPAETASLARQYFLISTLSAPALLATMSLTGWMIGKQNTVYPMAVAIGVNAINILLSFTFVYFLGLGFTGVALGTMTANWLGLALAVILAKRLQKGPLLVGWHSMRRGLSVKRFFAVNSNLMLRSACIMAVTFAMTGFASRFGSDLALAVNAVLMQLFLFFSFFMDGFAYAAEALCGKWHGASNRTMLLKSVRWLALWGLATTFVFAVLYWAASPWIASRLTDVGEVVARINSMTAVCLAIPLCSGVAFLTEGIYIGLTETRKMLIATFSAALVFFLGTAAIEWWHPQEAYNWLWGAFLLFLFMRSLVLGLWMKPTLRRV